MAIGCLCKTFYNLIYGYYGIAYCLEQKILYTRFKKLLKEFRLSMQTRRTRFNENKHPLPLFFTSSDPPVPW